MFSERLKTLRSEKELTQEQLARELGISNKSISVYEKGTSLPSIDTLARLASYFNVTVDYLIGYSDQRNPEISNIASKLYLSQEATMIIMRLSEQFNSVTNEPLTSTLNKVITNPHFTDFLELLSTFVSLTDKDWENMCQDFEKRLSKDLGFDHKKNHTTPSMMKSMFRSRVSNEIDCIIESLIEPSATE